MTRKKKGNAASRPARTLGQIIDALPFRRLGKYPVLVADVLPFDGLPELHAAAIGVLADAAKRAADSSAASIDDAIRFVDESNLRIADLETKGVQVDYNKDIIAWANEQAHLLRSGRLNEVDIENVADEIEDVGRREQRELASRMAVLLMHLLAWHSTQRTTKVSCAAIGQNPKFEHMLNRQRLAGRCLAGRKEFSRQRSRP